MNFDDFLEKAGIYGVMTLELKYDFRATPEWSCDLEHDKVTFTGKGDTLEEAVLEAWTDVKIGNYYYFGSMDTPKLTLEQMSAMRVDVYKAAGMEDECFGEYRGEYNRAP